MKMKPVLILVVAAVAVGGVGFGAYRFNRSRSVNAQISKLVSNGAPPETIEGLREAIDVYESKIEDQVRNAAQAGIYWKILAQRYMDRGMYDEALDALKRAVSYFPEDSTLYYMTGLSASVMAKSSLDFSRTGAAKVERDRLFALAVDAHSRAVQLDPKNVRALYALGVLYVFELDRPVDAVPVMERYLALQSKDADAMFILARAYYVLGRRDDAVALYDRILAATKDAARKSEAENNKKTVLDEIYAAK